MSKDKSKKEKVKVPKVDEALLTKVKDAQKALETYFKKNGLDPLKDHTKSKKHGEKVKALLAVINAGRDKIKDVAPAEQHHKKSEDKKKTSATPAEKVVKEKVKRNVAAKYDYPKVDGKEMTSLEKKKYRVKMRSGKTDATEAKPAKPAKTAKPEAKEVKSEKKSSKSEKSVKVEDKKSGKNKKKDKKKTRNED